MFYGANYFKSITGIPVNGGNNPQNTSVLVYPIPQQQALNYAPPVRRNNKAGM